MGPDKTNWGPPCLGGRPVCPGLCVGMGGVACWRRGLCLFVSRLAGTKGPIVVVDG